MQSAEIKKVEGVKGLAQGYLFNHTLGKTLKGDRTKIFWIWRSSNKDICPVTELETYVKQSMALGFDVRQGYLFGHSHKVLGRCQMTQFQRV